LPLPFRATRAVNASEAKRTKARVGRACSPNRATETENGHTQAGPPARPSEHGADGHRPGDGTTGTA
jgi:hypothetical protein